MAMRQLWLVAIGYSAGAKISSIKDFRVCSAHFSEDDYIPNQGGKSKKRILKSSAVPVPWTVSAAILLENCCSSKNSHQSAVSGQSLTSSDSVMNKSGESVTLSCTVSGISVSSWWMGWILRKY
ncbi:immunoglobulin zeta heavy [Labeo rohita]|nr:immunoglobulin zeta heavy [Labeo rohita]